MLHPIFGTLANKKKKNEGQSNVRPSRSLTNILFCATALATCQLFQPASFLLDF